MDGSPFDTMEMSERRRAFNRALMRGAARVQQVAVHHWLAFLNLTAGLFLGMAFAAPLLSAAGYDAAGRMLFDAYKLACHQLPGRSFFVFGEQVAFCQRDVAIFGTIFLMGLVFAFRRRQLRAPKWWVYALMALPMAVDGTTQLFGWRESTWELRVVTGALFGAGTVWFLYPYIERTMVDLWSESLDLLARAGNAERSQQGG